MPDIDRSLTPPLNSNSKTNVVNSVNLRLLLFPPFNSFGVGCVWGARVPSCRGPRAPCTCLALALRTSPGRVQEILGALHVLQSCCYCVGYKAQKGGRGSSFFSSLRFNAGGGGDAGGETHKEKSP